MGLHLTSTLDFFNSLNSLSVKELSRIGKHIDKLIELKSSDDRNYISSLNVDDFVSDSTEFLCKNEIENILSDLNCTDKFDSTVTNSKSLWLSTTSLPYKWTSFCSGKAVTKHAVPIKDFSHINQLLHRINHERGTSLNSCLIQYYPTGFAGIRLHDDFEWEMDQSQPFINVSIGESRRVEFLHNYQKSSERPAKVVNVGDGSMYEMKKGCQNFYRHRVPSEGPNKKARFCLSFRSILDLSVTPVINPTTNHGGIPPPPRDIVGASSLSPSPSISTESDVHLSPSAPPLSPTPSTESSVHVLPTAPPPSPTISSESGVHVEPSAPPPSPTTIPDNRDITVLFGTSITRNLGCNFISNDNMEFLNVSISGAKIRKHSRSTSSIPDFSTIVNNFATSNSDKLPRVKKVVFSIGTNDIKFLSNKSIGPLRKYICDLVNLSKSLFGLNVGIAFQSILPMRIMYSYTVENFLNFNCLLQNVCCWHGCQYLDWFNYFLDEKFEDVNQKFYFDSIHLNRAGIAVLNRLFRQFCRTSIQN